MRRNSRSRLSFKRRYRKFAWIFGSSAIVIALLYWEQAAVLYVVSTLAICALLLVVMFSNLEARDKELHEVALEKMDARDTESRRAASAHQRSLASKVSDQLWKMSVPPAVAGGSAIRIQNH